MYHVYIYLYIYTFYDFVITTENTLNKTCLLKLNQDVVISVGRFNGSTGF